MGRAGHMDSLQGEHIGSPCVKGMQLSPWGVMVIPAAAEAGVQGEIRPF